MTVVRMCRYAGGGAEVAAIPIMYVHTGPCLRSLFIDVCAVLVGVVRLLACVTLAAGRRRREPGGGPLRFMECHSVAAAVNQVNVADPIS